MGARANPTLPPEIAGDILGRMTVFMGTSWENLRKFLLMWRCVELSSWENLTKQKKNPASHV